jgi:hypothetical protein
MPILTIFTAAVPGTQPDSWVKVDADSYRRTYSYRRFTAADFATWTHVELTTPVDYSISEAEAARLEAAARRRPRITEMGG